MPTNLVGIHISHRRRILRQARVADGMNASLRFIILIIEGRSTCIDITM
jgi:hypothetical protein